MKRLMQILLLRLFGHKYNKNYMPKTTFKTTNPPERIPFDQWCREFNVSGLWDRKIIDMRN
jgi:hypothetical protein